jgi:ribonuclease HI
MLDNYDIYTDGAYSSIRHQGGSSIIVLKNNLLILEWSKMWRGGTNNTAELLSIIVALKAIKDKVGTINIYSDSQYCIGCAVQNWKRKKNIKLWKEFDKQLLRVRGLCENINFYHIKGHNGNYWNSYCDKLAVQASKEI